MLKPSTQVRTLNGGKLCGYWYAYGTIAGTYTEPNTHELLYKVEWNEGDFDYLGDYELELVEE